MDVPNTTQHGTRRLLSPLRSPPRSGGVRRRAAIVLATLVAAATLRWELLVPAANAAASSEAIDATTGGACLDSDPVNCPFWAATGECQANRGYMHTHCKKSCDRCHIVRVQNRNEMNRLIAQKKQELAEKKERLQREKEALRALQAGNPAVVDGSNDSTASRTATATISETGEIEITGGSVGDDAREEETGTKNPNPSNEERTVPETADANPDPVVESNTPKVETTSAAVEKKQATTTTPTKKKAKIDAETGLECVDLDEANCPFWAATGDCKTNRRFMSTNCRLSCDRCHIVRVNSQNDIQKFISRQKKETDQAIAARRKAREFQKVLEGGGVGG